MGNKIENEDGTTTYVVEKDETVNDVMMAEQGQKLVDAHKLEDRTEYDHLVLAFRHAGLTKPDITLLELVTLGEVDRKLMFAGVASSRILALSPEDRARLLTDTFEIRQADKDDVRNLTWAEMTYSERARLIGTKGQILAPNSQPHWSDPPRRSNSWFGAGVIEPGHRGDVLALTHDERDFRGNTANIRLENLRETLRAAGQLDQLIAYLSEPSS